MAAYGALTSLLLTLDNIRDHNLPISLDSNQLGSLRERVSLLLHSLQNCSDKNHDSLETKIRDVAFRAEDLIAGTMYQSFLYNTPGLLPRVFSRTRVLKIFACFSLVFLAVVIILAVMEIPLLLPLLLVSGLLIPIGIWFWDSRSALPLFIKKRLVNLFVRDGTEDLRVLKKIFKEIKLIAQEETAALAGGAEGAGLPSVDLQSAAASSSSRHSRINGIGKVTVVGMDSAFDYIKTRLGYGQGDLQIVSIVGMGGIGKTTLAEQVYKDAYICHRFDVRAWATVSQEYCFSGVVEGLLNSAGLPTMQGEGDNGKLGDYLYRSFHGRRYLIVLDDVWDVEIWDNVRRFLPHDNNGSCVLLTTRSSELARCASSQGSQFQMHFLDECDSQMLLHSRVFGEEDCPDELRVMRDEIARSSKGLPLALVVIGGLLSKIDKTPDSWRDFADRLLLAANTGDDNDECMEILALSYNCLPHHLRPCFLHMGMFPEDYAVPVMKLILLWVGEGFLQPDNSRSPEELAEEYLKELVERNLIMIDGRSSQGKIKICKIHDVLRRLCLREARKEKFLFAINLDSNVSETGIESYRRLSIHPNILKSHPKIMNAKELLNSAAHSLMSIGNHLTSSQDNVFLYKPLRVLDLLTLHFATFPLHITRLVSLRYLALSFTGSLHPNILRLQNLQIFVHRNVPSHEIGLLPVEIWMIPNLRHILVPPTLLSTLPNGTTPFSLQTLAEVINLSFDSQSLDKIISLKKLRVSYAVEQQSFKGWFEHKLENLVCLIHLETLRLRVTSSRFTYPQNLDFPRALKKLTLSGCRFPWERLAIVGALPDLEVLKLRHNAYEGAEWEPVEGQFSKLIFLELKHMNLVHWKADETHFPRLQCLILNSCHQLEEIPLRIGDITTLQRIDLINCHPGIVASAKSIQEDQEQNTGSSDIEVSVSYNY